MDDDREERIRRRAHQIWEEDGRPVGQEAEHWKRAVREIDGDTGQPDRAEGERTQPLSEQPGSSGITSGRKPTDDASTAEPPYSELRRG